MGSKSKDILEKFEKFTNMQNSVDRFERSIGKIRSNRAEASGQNRFGIDKHREGFVRGMSDYGCIPLNIGSYESFSGSYGSSSVYSDVSNDDFVSASMFKAINNLKDVILDETLNVMKRETEECKKEAKEGYEYLKTLFESL